MSIVAIRDKRTFIVTEERRGHQYSVQIDKNATVRKLYRAVRKTCGVVSTAIELRTGSGELILKDDRQLTTAAINSDRLSLRILPTPDMFTIFVTLPGRQEQSTIQIEETKSLEELYTMVKHKINRNTPPPEIQLEYGTGIYVEGNSSLIYKELMDGATLVARYVKITVYVEVGKRSYTVKTSLNGTIKELFDELSKQLPDHDFQLITGTQQLRREDNKTLAELEITHLSTLTVVARFRGGYSNLFYSLHAIL